MAKKQKKQHGQQFLSNELYIRQKARTLEVGKCYVSVDFESCGEGYVVVSRNHTGGKVSAGFYMIDIWCVGLKDSFYRLRMEKYEFQEMIDGFYGGLRECSYEEAHNWIYGSIAFADEVGIEPNKSFNLSKYMLEEDDDNIPLIEYQFGKDGRHALFVKSHREASRYLPLLEKNLGKGNFEFFINDDNEWDDDEWDEDDEIVNG